MNTNETKTVDLNGDEFVLLIGSNAHYGNLEDLKAEIWSYVEDGGDTKDCYLGIYKPLKNVEISSKKQFKVEMEDDSYNEFKTEYQIIYKGRVLDEYDYDDEALERIKIYLEEGEYNQDELELVRKVEFTCLCDIDEETEVVINIPAQPIEKINGEKDPSAMTVQEINDELLRISERISLLSDAKVKAVKDVFEITE